MKNPQEIIALLIGEKGILNPKYALQNGEKIGSVWLQENDAMAKLKSLKILDISEPYATLKPDAFAPSEINFYLNSASENINKACDGILFVVHEEKAYILICELKSEYPKESEYKPKFQAAACFLDYLDSLLKEFYDANLTAFKRKNILFYYQKTDKPLANFNKKNISPVLIRDEKLQKKPQCHSENQITLNNLLKNN